MDEAQTFDLAPESQEVDELPAIIEAPPTPAAPPIVAGKQTLGYANLADACSEDPHLPQRVIDLHLPLWALTGGIVIEVAVALVRGRESLAAVRGEMIAVAIALSVGTVATIAGMFVAAWLERIDLGPWRIAAFKLAATSVAATGAGALIHMIFGPIPIAGLLSLGGEFIVCFALIGALFTLDHGQTWFCVIVIFVVNLAVFLAAMTMRRQ